MCVCTQYEMEKRLRITDGKLFFVYEKYVAQIIVVGCTGQSKIRSECTFIYLHT